MSLFFIGKEAPHFQADATQADSNGNVAFKNIALSELKGKYVILFFYPLDFTFVCPTELHAFEKQRTAFENEGAVVLGCSVDSKFSHKAWLESPIQKGGIQSVQYPILSDINKEVARDFGCLGENGLAYRATYIIDKEGVIQVAQINNLPIGRNVDEILRLLQALKNHEQTGNVCPAQWKPGEKDMTPTQEGLESFFEG